MPFVKLDCGLLDSTLWMDRPARDVFLTALLMAEPYEITEPTPELEIRRVNETSFVVPPGWYGFVRAAGVGILRRAGVDDQEEGLAALERLASPEGDSRSPDFEGRRLVRIDGGFIVLNHEKYRRRDYTAAARQKRYRERHRNGVTASRNAVTPRHITQAEAVSEVKKQYIANPNGSDPLVVPIAALWAIYIEELGGDPPHPRLTKGRTEKLTALYREQLHEAADPCESFRVILQRVKASEWHMGKREYQLPESLFRNEERRDRWASGQVGGSDGDDPAFPNYPEALEQ